MDHALRNGLIVGRLTRIALLLGAMIALALLGQTLAMTIIAAVLLADSVGTFVSIAYVRRHTS